MSGFSLSLQMVQMHDQGSYRREALKAFRKFEVGGVLMYTCNVDRLIECDRLAPSQSVSLWRTHFFLRSNNFDDVTAVVFNRRPGSQLSDLSKEVVEYLYLAISPNEMVDTSNGDKMSLREPLIFASNELSDE